MKFVGNFTSKAWSNSLDGTKLTPKRMEKSSQREGKYEKQIIKNMVRSFIETDLKISHRLILSSVLDHVTFVNRDEGN